MWVELEFEEIVERKLVDELEGTDGKDLFAYYRIARKNLCEEILDEIKVKLPHHTDHGIKHVRNVIENTFQLLGEEVENICSVELYCLLMGGLFHDVGNYHDRKNHRNNIQDIYIYARKDNAKYRMEQVIVTEIVKAHCGLGRDNSTDTLKFVDPVHFHDVDKEVKIQELAAVLRFADELAEGQQRTSFFRNQNGNYPDENKIFQDYAQCTNISIDRKNGRIALTYNVNLDTNSIEGNLEALLKYVFERIVKLDQERRYTKHYTDYLLPFKKTTVSFNFFKDGRLIELGLNSLSLTDLVLPNENYKKISDYDDGYEIPNILRLLKKKVAQENHESNLNDTDENHKKKNMTFDFKGLKKFFLKMID